MSERGKRLIWLGAIFVAAVAELVFLPHRWHTTLIPVVALVACVWGFRNETAAPAASSPVPSRPAGAAPGSGAAVAAPGWVPTQPTPRAAVMPSPVAVMARPEPAVAAPRAETVAQPDFPRPP